MQLRWHLLGGERYVSREHPFDFAILHAQLGGNDQAFEWLDKACAGREYRMVFLKVHPLLDGLHADPCFRSLLRQ